MRSRVALALLGCLVFCAPQALLAAESANLSAPSTSGKARAVELLIESSGQLKVPGETEPATLEMKLEAKQKYDEMPRAVTSDAQLASARHYQRAEADIQIDGASLHPALSAEHQTICLLSDRETATLFCPTAPLTREELDLLDVPFNSLLVDQLLPQRQVEVGEKWEHDTKLLALLLGLDAISTSDVRSHLVRIQDGTARIEIEGNVEGAIEGVASELKLTGKYDFDLKTETITWLAAVVDENRSMGHISPGIVASSRVQMRVTPIETPAELSAAQIASLPIVPGPEQMQLLCELTPAGFRFRHDRRWHVIDERSDSVTMRLVDRGELVAQCNVALLSPVAAGQHGSLNDFQSRVEKALGDHFEQFIEATEQSHPEGLTLYRTVAIGHSDDLAIQWIYYLLADPTGRRLVLGFTVESDLVERFASADHELILSAELFTPPTDTASRAESAARK
jgi:hypothetical protein